MHHPHIYASYAHSLVRNSFDVLAARVAIPSASVFELLVSRASASRRCISTFLANNPFLTLFISLIFYIDYVRREDVTTRGIQMVSIYSNKSELFTSNLLKCIFRTSLSLQVVRRVTKRKCNGRFARQLLLSLCNFRTQSMHAFALPLYFRRRG